MSDFDPTLMHPAEAEAELLREFLTGFGERLVEFAEVVVDDDWESEAVVVALDGFVAEVSEALEEAEAARCRAEREDD